jgi:hypothetical protein
MRTSVEPLQLNPLYRACGRNQRAAADRNNRREPLVPASWALGEGEGKRLQCPGSEWRGVANDRHARWFDGTGSPRSLSSSANLGLWVAIDADTKVGPCVMLGSRNASDAQEFIADLASRLRHRVQLTSDGYRPYLEAVEAAFGADIDYAMLVKLYGQDPENERRYSPAKCIGAVPTVITGRPDPSHISTSFVERRIGACVHRCAATRGCRMASAVRSRTTWRLSRSTISRTTSSRSTGRCVVSPAMAAGVTARLFDVMDLVNLLIESESDKAA